jgi:hypothetical protein
MYNKRKKNTLIIFINSAGVLIAYGLLGISLWLSTDVPLATKGFWGMGILLLTLSLINVVKYRFDAKSSEDRINRIEEARNEKLLEEALTKPPPAKPQKKQRPDRSGRCYMRGRPSGPDKQPVQRSG